MLMLLLSNASAQQPFMWHLTEEDGLPSMEVYNIHQDAKGFIWFGTDNGVCRYDGHVFKTYYHPKQRGKSFSYFIEDHQNRLWCINFAGQIFYIENDSMKLFEPFEQVYKSGFPRYTFDKDNKLWIISSGNPLLCYDFKQNQLSAVGEKPFFYVNNIIGNKKGDLLVNAEKMFHYRNGKYHSTIDGNLLAEYSKYEDELYLIDPNGTKPRITRFENGKQGTTLNTEALKNNNARFTDFISFGTNDRWYLTYDGAYQFSGDEKQSTLHSHILKGNAVSWIIKDRDGNYWISTLKNGVFIIPSNQTWLMNDNNSSLRTNRVNKIAYHHNDRYLYLGSGLGDLVKFNIETKQIEQQIGLEKTQKDFDALDIDQAGGYLYAHSNKSYQINIHTLKVKNSFLNFSSIKDFAFDGYGNFVLASSFTSYFILGDSEKAKQSPFIKNLRFETLNATIKENKTFTGSLLRTQRSVACHVSAADTSIWIAFVDGLYYYKNGKQYEFRDEKNKPVYVTDFDEDRDGVIWTSTIQQGLLAIKKAQTYLHLTKADGLKSDYIRCVSAGDQKIWFATDKGIQAYDKSKQTFFTFDKNSGLATLDVLDIKAINKEVFLATSKGLQWFDETVLHESKVKPTLFIDAIQINDKDINLTHQQTFKHNQNNIVFHFTGLSFANKSSFQYAYRLLGLDTAWQLVEATEREAHYQALPPGHYQFEIKLITKSGITSDVLKTESFTIQAPYWQQWWFYLIIIASITAVVGLLFQYRIHLISKRNKLEREKSKLEIELRTSQLSALKVQMNPHFIFNALNSIQEYILTNEKKLANSYLGKFSDLMRLYLDMSNKRSISLEEEIKAMKLYLELEAMRFEENFSYTLTVDPKLSIDEITIPPMIIQPYVENALKHGLLHKRNDRKLSIEFKWAPNQTLVCVVTDNGIGMKQSMELNKIRHKKHASFASGATQKRLELLNAERNEHIGVVYQDLYINETTPNGTRVTITVPYN